MPKAEKNPLQIGVRALKELLSLARKKKNDTAELSGPFGSAIANAVENKHLHKRAFRSVVVEDRMEPEALADFYDAQEYYRDALGLNERAKNAPRLPIDAPAEKEDAEDKEPGSDAGNVRTLRAPASAEA